MKIYNVYVWTEDENGRHGLEQYSTSDARRVLADLRGCIAYGSRMNVVVNGKSVVRV